MRTKQLVEFQKQDRSYEYVLHQQSLPVSTKKLISLPPLIKTTLQPTTDALAEKSAIFTHMMLESPPPVVVSTLMFSYQDKSTNQLVRPLPHLNDVSPTKLMSLHHNNQKRTCFPKKCDFPMCKNSSRSRGFCYSHGGGRRCRVNGCNNGAVSRDLCKRHGGGRRCRIAGCTSSSESGGLCYSHGGGRRCNLSWCSARAKKGGYCAVHLTGDRTPPADTFSTSTSDSSSSTDVNIVETLLLLANDQKNVTQLLSMSKEASVSSFNTIKRAYDIASLLN
ncbi:uncharacterized protein PHALS_04834 [Plasmopara halstedii]|uniref:WRKY19-like zinc finger domain-containing protein n=1 Tax=Plasmopara halstedii TaxID=4781 RepID=A0A0P1B279_PLAHL|nr:uncharacterized protein PHALS_04834 [Plasmopara halstedii]CEG47687.1 hypothetical protein PHALS_04834 [Plasmopara halstedii]|eukprot:XP_024584056.1 hypothetical protein PHALS_04834 [Plasmopara halstedii]